MKKIIVVIILLILTLLCVQYFNQYIHLILEDSNVNSQRIKN